MSEISMIDVKIIQMSLMPEGGRVKAFVNIGINDAILIKGIRVVDGKRGLFISMPADLGKDDKWYARVRCLNKTVKDHINMEVLKAYKKGTGNATS